MKPAPPAPARLRVATYNVSFFTERAGGLPQRLLGGTDAAARKVAAVIQRVRPDLLLLNEFDYEPDGASATLFQREYLGVDQPGSRAIDYPHRFFAEVNTGVPSGLDLDGDGRADGPADAWGFGHYPGQYGMLVLSRFPLDTAALRSFRLLRWAAVPGALQPWLPGAPAPYYDAATWSQLRLSSKSHWDLPVATPLGRLHFLVMHPTPPVFDGPEDRNGRRNHDEIRLFADYLDPARAGWLVDDQGRTGAIEPGAAFVLAGDFNADPLDGDTVDQAIDQLLRHPRVDASFVPAANGGAAAHQARLATAAADPEAYQPPPLRGDPRHHTGSFGLRVDYVLPSRELRVVDGGVFWPAPGEPDAELADGSDHHLVWLDLERRSGADAD